MHLVEMSVPGMAQSNTAEPKMAKQQLICEAQKMVDYKITQFLMHMIKKLHDALCCRKITDKQNK